MNPLVADSILSRRRFVYAAAALLSMTASLGCSKSPDSATVDTSNKFTIISTVYPLGQIARSIAGPYADVSWFCEYGQDPRDLKITDKQLNDSRKADILITSGFGETWAGDMLTSTQRHAVVISPQYTSTGKANDNSRTAMWLHPQIVMETADLMRERFTVRDAKHADEFKANYAKIAAEVDQVDADFHKALAQVKSKKFLAIRPVWNGIIEQYGLEEIAPINTVAHKVTDEDIEKLKKAAVENETNILAIDAATLPGVQRDLQQRTGFKLLLLDTMGSSAPDANSTWPKLMRFNLHQFVKAMN